MAYTPRLSAPSTSNTYYYKSNPFYQCGYGLPNCTCYAWGRFYEVLGSKPRLSTANAEDWWGYNDGYQRGQTPRLGAVICWRKGRTGTGADGAGHVGIVEQISADGTITIGQSGWGSSRTFWTTSMKKPYYLSGYALQGFIYNPSVTDTTIISDDIAVDGQWGQSTTYKTQQVMGTAQDGIVSGQLTSCRQYLQGCLTSSWQFSTNGSGSPMVKAIQKLVGATQDGIAGKGTVTAMQKFLNSKGFNSGVVDGYMGKNTIMAWQKYINSRL